MNEFMKEMTPEKLRDIYTSEKFRNAVAYAHGCYLADMKFKCFKAMDYPDNYKVTQSQIDEARAEIKRAKIELIKTLGNKLVFVGMGMNYIPRYEGDPGNHRIRTEIINNKGVRFFIEVGTGYNGMSMRVDHSVNRTIQDAYKDSHLHQGKFYNWGDLERRNDLPDYTDKNIITMVNRAFDCNFSEMIVDNYNLTTEDYFSTSK
jgi:hypothetical protein